MEIETVDSIYFYSHKPNLKFCWMSNFYPVEFTYNDIHFFNTEQFLMYMKCITFDPYNIEYVRKILATKNPSEVKKLGRGVKNYNNKIWEEKRYNLFLEGLYEKFNQNEELKEKLLSTGNKTIYEASKNDNIWGIGYNAIDAQKVSVQQYGENLLGKALMEVRNIFYQENLYK